jgi:hypothetical protein
MSSKKAEGLVPLRFFADEGGRDIRCLELIRNAWPIIAGPGNGSITHPISFRHGQLLIGCHDSSVLSAMRDSAQNVGAELCKRIYEMLKIRIQRIEVTASDPEPAPLQRAAPASRADIPNPLEAVLDYYGKIRNYTELQSKKIIE